MGNKRHAKLQRPDALLKLITTPMKGGGAEPARPPPKSAVAMTKH